jgi:hypothetical protein
MHKFSLCLQILKLSLNKEPFEVMITGEKKVEYRGKSNWMTSRLVDSKTNEDKVYDLVQFTNGYGKDKPYFTAVYKGYELAKEGVHKKFPNGLVVNTKGTPTYCIQLGRIVDKSIPSASKQ